MRPPSMSGFIGIDWSGAKGPQQQGIQLAVAAPGRTAPLSIACPDQRYWGRVAVTDYLIARAESAIVAGQGPILVGIDFAFSHPFHDVNAFYPGADDAPQTAAALWAHIDAINAKQDHFYGGGIFSDPIYGAYYLSPRDFKAPLYASRRRQCEVAARAAGRSPSPTFKAVGADNVATGSLAGMRVLHHLKQRLGSGVCVWPFDPIERAADPSCGLVMTEIFPSFHFHRVGFDPAKKAALDPAFLSAALAAYDSDGVTADFVPSGQDADEADAMIAAAALRFYAPDWAMWQVPEAARIEGWIFGVPADDNPPLADGQLVG